jgi:DNA-binding NarL/FixJ family response regulator
MYLQEKVVRHLAVRASRRQAAAMQHGQWASLAAADLAPALSRPLKGGGASVSSIAQRSKRSSGSRKDAGASGTKLRVLVCSADPFTRRAFGSGASASDIEVVARANLTEAVENLAAELEPDVVVLDVQVPAATALRAIQQLHLEAPDARILACDAPAGTEFGLLCLLAGASGYMSKEADLAALPRILRALAAGEVVTPRALATELAHRFVSAARRAPKSSGHVLSRPESQVLELLRTGRPLPEIASDLGIRPSTAQRHLGSARRKLAVLASTPHRFQTELEV